MNTNPHSDPLADVRAQVARFAATLDSDDSFLLPGEAMALMKLGDLTDPERRRVFERMRDGFPGLRRRTINGVACVHLVDWRYCLRVLRALSGSKADWSEGVERFLDAGGPFPARSAAPPAKPGE